MLKERTQYYETIFGQEDPTLKKIKEEAQKEGVEFMQLSCADAHILQMLTHLSQAKTVIEIGGLYGYSTVHIARGLRKDGQVISIDIDQKRQNQGRKILKDLPEFSKIKWVHGDAHQILKKLQGPFDMIFIDADKIGYLNYLHWAKTHLKVGGFVVADNSFLFHTLYAQEPELSQLRKKHGVSKESEKTLRQFNHEITSSSFWKAAMIPTEDGLSVAIKIK